MRGPVQKTCEQCGQLFECGQYGCWCGQVPLTDRQFGWIAGRYDDCLCRFCLETISTDELGQGSDMDRRPDR